MPALTVVDKHSLGALEPIARGAVGQVYRVPGFTLPGAPGPLAFKELHATLKPDVRQDTLKAMKDSVAFRDALSPDDQADLDEYTTWPLAMVKDRKGLCGLLMPLIPPDFFITTRPAGGGPSAQLPFDLSWLCAKDAQAQVKGVDRSGVQDPLVRIALLTQLVYAVARLHKHGAVYGDLSLKNAVLALNPPRVKLIDCDAAASLTNRNRKQLHSPFLTPPEITSGAQKLQDTQTDVYKLGLCIIRGLQQGRGVTQASDPDALRGLLDAPALDAVRRAVGGDRAARPSGKELFGALEHALLSRAAPPVLHAATVAPPIRVRGMDVTVTWSASGARRARIRGANGLEIILDHPDKHPHGYVVIPRASGDIVVEVENEHGTASMTAGRVDLYDLPTFTLAQLPRTVVPEMPRFTIPESLSALPPRPAVSTLDHPVPRVEAPSMAPVFDLISTAHGHLSPLARADEALTEAAGQLRQAVDGTAGVGPVPAVADAVTRASQDARTLIDSSLGQLRDALDQQLAQAPPQHTNGGRAVT